MNYLLAILLFLLTTEVMEGAEVKPATKLQAKTITGARSTSIYSNTARKQLQHEWATQYQPATLHSVSQTTASPKSIEADILEFAFPRNSDCIKALLYQLSPAVPIGQLLLFPNHFFW